jgi:hypothetical protein
MIRNLWKPIGPVLASQILPVVIATIFLVCPAGLLVSLARSPGGQDAEEDYRQAVEEASWPNPKHVSTSLYSFKYDHPVTVVTWTQSQYVTSYRQADPARIPKDLWVTIVPFMRAFCQEYVRANGANEDKLALRLRQRLGLPPDSVNDTFVELTVDPREKARLFRPCSDPSVDANTCQAPSLPPASDVWGTATSSQMQEWMFRNYYSSYATGDPYPWTALGYTFDWSRNADSDGDFVRFGESEFVIPANDPVHFVSAASTTTYCSAR